MSTKGPSTEHDLFMTVEIRDPNGQKTVVLEGLRRSASVAEVRSRAMSALRLPEHVEWNVRHERSGRLLQEEQRLADFTGVGEQVMLKMQPDAGLG